MSDLPDYYPGGADLILRPEWAALVAIDKTFASSKDPAAYGEYCSVTYLVPVGKTLFIDILAFYIVASAAIDGDSNQFGNAYLFDVTTGVVYGLIGGNGGNVGPLVKPAVIPAGHTIDIRCYSRANHNTKMTVYAAGYEV